MEKAKILRALKELRKEKQRKFNESVDLIINLKNYDLKRQPINLVIELPHKIKDVKIGGFLEKKSDIIDTILKNDFGKYKEKKDIKKLIKTYDYFVASARLMPLIASAFGKYLGPVGKMPSPQFGIITSESEGVIKSLVGKAEKICKIRPKETSLKICVGKKEMKDEEIVENIIKVYNTVFGILPRKQENLKNILIKFTMSKPAKL